MNMATLSRASYIIFALVLIFTAGTQGDLICSEDFGICDPECSSRCQSTHPGAKAACDLNNNNPVCRCYFNCPPPPPPPPSYSKHCKTALGFWGAGCRDEDCNAQCVTNFPGPEQGVGYCFSVDGEVQFTECFCEYRGEC